MRITNVGYDHFHGADLRIDRPEGSGDHLLLLLKTPAVFELGGVEQRTEAGSVILFNIGTPQRYRAAGGEFGNDWIHFLPDSREDERFIKALGFELDRLYRLDSISQLSLLVDMMCRENYSRDRFKADTTDLLLKLFLIKLSEKLSSTRPEAAGTWFDKLSILRTKIYNDPGRAWSIDGLAHELTMSRSSFQHLYKKSFGVTAMNDVIAARTELAKYLLSTTDHSVAHIAQTCGYSSDIHFMRQFKQRTGQTPSQFRAGEQAKGA